MCNYLKELELCKHLYPGQQEINDGLSYSGLIKKKKYYKVQEQQK